MAQRKSVRARTLTEGGESYHYDSSVKKLRKVETDILKRLNHIENLISSDSFDSSLVRSELKHVDDLQRQFVFIYEQAQNMFSNDNLLTEFFEWTERIDHEIFFVKSSTINWLKKVEGYHSEISKSRSSSNSSKRSSKSDSTRSCRSTLSHRSISSRSKIIDEQTELAALEVRREFIEKKGAAEQMSYLDEEIAVRRVKFEVLQGHLHSSKIAENSISFPNSLINSEVSTHVSENLSQNLDPRVSYDYEISLSNSNSFSSTVLPAQTNSFSAASTFVIPSSFSELKSSYYYQEPSLPHSTASLPINTQPFYHSSIYTAPPICF